MGRKQDFDSIKRRVDEGLLPEPIELDCENLLCAIRHYLRNHVPGVREVEYEIENGSFRCVGKIHVFAEFAGMIEAEVVRYWRPDRSLPDLGVSAVAHFFARAKEHEQAEFARWETRIVAKFNVPSEVVS